MAEFLPDSRAALFAGLLLPCLLLAGLPADAASPRADSRGKTAAAGSQSEGVDVDAASWELDRDSNQLHLKDVTISQGAIRIQAEDLRADGPNLRINDSRWEFKGNVRIRFENGTMSSDTATVSFKANRMANALVIGQPAQFEQRVPNLPRPVRGRAGSIDYDILGGSVRFSKEVRFFDGRNEVNVPALVYNVRSQRSRSDIEPGSGGRVHLTIRPDDAAEAPANDAEATAPPTPETPK